MSGNASSATETDTTTAPAAETNASSGSSGITVPNYADLLSKMEYGDNSSDTNKLNAIITANPSLFELPSGAIDERALNCSISAPVNFLYLSTIRGGRKMKSEVEEAIVGGCGCGMKGGGSNKYLGGCFTCKKGTKNIALIYSGIHIIIPKLYSKYHTENATKAVKAIKKAKPAKAAKKAKAKTV